MAASLWLSPCRALDCGKAANSSCIDSNQQWLDYDPGPFMALPSAESLKRGQLSFAVAGVYQYRPLVLNAPSPDSKGRDIPVVRHVVDWQMLVGAGLGAGVELGVQLRMVPYQTGTGIDAARTRSHTGLQTRAVRDPLISVGYEAAAGHRGALAYGFKLRTDLSLPLGDAMAFAGSPNAVFAPSWVAGLSYGALSTGVQIGTRLRQPVSLGNVRTTSQLVTGVGVGLRIVRDILWVSTEATAMPGLTRQPPAPSGQSASFIPAEWALTATVAWADAYSFAVSAGTAIPLSSSRVDFGDETHVEHFAGLGSPALRTVAVLRVTAP